MKRLIFLVAGLLAVAACSKVSKPRVEKDPLIISSPTPSEQITKVVLTDKQQQYVKAGNAMSLRFLKEMYDNSDIILSPLSLQYAMAMTANGASGETLKEITDFLGYGTDGIAALNEYSKILLNQLPAVDLDVVLKVTDALVVRDDYPLLPAFQKTMEDYYYAAVDNMSFSDPSLVVDRINDWTKLNTNGVIDKLLASSDIDEYTVAILLNALYFKAKWADNGRLPMFIEGDTHKDRFTLSNGTIRTVNIMNTANYFQYALMDGFRVLALPYAGGKFFMYILLPDKNDVNGLLGKLQGVSWSEITGSFCRDALVYVKLPKFDIENTFNLNDALKAMGVKRAFGTSATFDQMFAPKGHESESFYIGKVLQKAKISLAEWGTEAAAVTAVILEATSAGPGETPQPKKIYFYADHPFVFVIGESTSGTILFEGVYSGK
jgi:serpin B